MWQSEIRLSMRQLVQYTDYLNYIIHYNTPGFLIEQCWLVLLPVARVDSGQSSPEVATTIPHIINIRRISKIQAKNDKIPNIQLKSLQKGNPIQIDIRQLRFGSPLAQIP